MRFEDALKEIESFWHDKPIGFQGGGQDALDRLYRQFTSPFPDELKEYVSTVLPPKRFSLEIYGQYLTLYGYTELSNRHDGYNWNPRDQKSIEGWGRDWFLIGDREADPVIVDLSRMGTHCPVWEAGHGAGAWKFRQIANSLPQYLLCAAYMHHALTQLNRQPLIMKKQFLLPTKVLLADNVAAWLLPRIRRCDEAFYGYWVGHFTNA